MAENKFEEMQIFMNPAMVMAGLNTLVKELSLW
jgi:hypothetical protein